MPVCSAVVSTTGSASSLFTLFLNFPLSCHTTLFPISQDSECLSKSSTVVHYPLQLTWPNEPNNDLFQLLNQIGRKLFWITCNECHKHRVYI
jgi:hypothetical protein